MSYCRWSSDDYQCDVYVYESADGFVTHVASNRRTFSEPLPPPVTDGDMVAFVARHEKVSRMCAASTLTPIGLPEDGETFTDSTAGECAETLAMLKALGYLVPQYAIDELLEEADR